MKNERVQKLHKQIESLLKMRGEIIHGETHVLNISEEEDIDHFSVVHYRVYNPVAVFDVIRDYDSDRENGAGGIDYVFVPCSWDGFESIKETSIDDAEKIVRFVIENPTPKPISI